VKKKAGRKKAAVTVVNDSQSDNIIDQLVSIGTAQTAEPAAAPAKRGRKPKATVAAPAEPVVVAPVVAEKEKKPRKTTTKKEKTAPVVEEPKPTPEPVVTADQEDDDDELVTREYILNGKQILVDEENNAYDFNTHEPIGTFDALNSKLIPL
jgi:hypothetical protein